ncbi:hypothetical protein [Pyxidicoccus xibeiensis]|uniref:hypothetical protein n=1 Tax=Pyxidicoccus xibeiensis TaxID=2906759 RepID=UPI0020A724EA|nr:hypothetical protein [Pyxidicoccus xibeiensis]MCP3139449.1 hypothetical protein [Pyxidicoccus xibeiensis]
MKSAIMFLRAMTLVGASLALTACGGDLPPAEAGALEADALGQAESELGSCANWSEWNNSGATTCEYRSCGFYWHCDGEWLAGAPANDSGAEPDELLPPPCEDGSYPYRVNNPGTFAQQYSYRACFNEAGTYTHTEYQYQNVLSTCGC